MAITRSSLAWHTVIFSVIQVGFVAAASSRRIKKSGTTGREDFVLSVEFRLTILQYRLHYVRQFPDEYFDEEKYKRTVAVSQDHISVFITYYFVEEMWVARTNISTSHPVACMDSLGEWIQIGRASCRERV